MCIVPGMYKMLDEEVVAVMILGKSVLLHYEQVCLGLRRDIGR